MGLFDNDPVAAARWTRDQFDGDVLEHADAFRLARPPGWTIRGTAGERYQLRPPPHGPAVDVDIALAPRAGMPTTLDAPAYLRLYLSLIDDPVEDLVVTTDAFGRRVDGRWSVGETASGAAVLLTRTTFVLATTSALVVDADAVAEGARVLAALEPLG
ncbi:hypothetical protein ACXR2U_03395 [Jatrophihabitans sp. YIM 134969]